MPGLARPWHSIPPAAGIPAGVALAGAAGAALALAARAARERDALRAQLSDLAFHDPLTGLPNRVLLTRRVTACLDRAAAGPAAGGLVFLDLDGFKHVNDSAGHDVGDRVLIGAARLLAGSVGPHDTVARFGGDEFAVLVRRGSRSEVVDVARLLARAVRVPVQLGQSTATVTASVGVAFTGDAEDAAGLLRAADLAMYRAKQRGSGRVEVYRPELLEQARRRADLTARLVRALDDRAFALLYQPVVDLASGRVVGAEALLRWVGDGGTLMPPADLVAVAESSGRIEEVGRWVVREALAQAACWRDSGHRIDVAVNLSTAQLGPGLVDVLDRALRDAGVPAAALTLELTESMLIRDGRRSLQRLHELKRLGVRLTLDGFGTGYSSLAYLRRLPADAVKLDGSFARDLGRGPRTETVVAAVVRLCTQLGLTVTAAGVESAAQARALRAMGVHRAQGFHFAGPQEASGVAALVATGPLPQPATLRPGHDNPHSPRPGRVFRITRHWATALDARPGAGTR